MNNELVIEYREIHEAPYDCDCCGSCFPEGFEIYFNNKMIYEFYSDGHTSGSRTEGDIGEILLNEYVELRHSENKYDDTEWYAEEFEDVKPDIIEDYRKLINSDITSNIFFDEMAKVKLMCIFIERFVGEQRKVRIIG